MQKKVTLFINSLTLGGAERVLSLILTELVHQGVDVELFCIEKDNRYPIPKEVNVTYLSSLTKDANPLKKFFYLFYLAFKLKRYVKERNINIIQSHIYRASFINILAKLFGSPHQVQIVDVNTVHSLQNRGFSKKIDFQLVKLLYRHADVIIFKAQKMKIEFFKHVHYEGKSLVINNPYNIEEIQAQSNEIIEDFNFNTHKKYLITVGRLTKIKSQLSLIKVLKHLDENIELIIIGEGEEKDNLTYYTQKNNLQDRVHLLGAKKNPFKYIKQADAFVLASKGEGFPNVLIESMICATPVISTDCISGPREILAPNTDINFQLTSNIELAENGILYPVDSQKDLINAITTLLNDKKQQEAYIKNSLINSKAYRVEAIVKKYQTILLNE